MALSGFWDGCRGRRPRRPAGVRQTGVHGQPPGRADVYGVGCRGGIYPSRGACGSGNIHGASRTPPPTTGSLCVGRPGMGNTASSRRPVGRPPYVPLLGLCVGRGDPTPPKVYVVTRSTDGHRVCAIGCRGRRPRRPAGIRQTGAYGHPPGRACPVPTARLWAGAHLYYSRRAACPHAAEGLRGRPFNGWPRKLAAACGQAALRAPFWVVRRAG